MTKRPDLTRGGSKVLRHTAVADGRRVEEGDEATIEAITAHMTACLGETKLVWHEIVSDRVHLDVHVIEGDDAITLYTTGMSDLPMTVDPSATGSPLYAELMLQLPTTWQLSKEAFADEHWYWPVGWLKQLARLPHEYATWLDWGHTIPNGDPPKPLAPGVPFVGFIIGPPTSLDEAQANVIANGRSVAIFAIYPLHADEMSHKLEHGTDSLFERLDAAGVTDQLSPNRPSVVPRRGRRR
jgi:hypothetical protein